MLHTSIFKKSLHCFVLFLSFLTLTGMATAQCPVGSEETCADVTVSIFGPSTSNPFLRSNSSIFIRNNGPAALPDGAVSVKLTNSIPAGWTVSAPFISVFNGSTNALVCGFNGFPACSGSLTTGIPLGPMPVNSSYAIGFFLYPEETACPPSSVTPTATYNFNGSYIDPVAANNSATASTVTGASTLYGSVFIDRNGSGTFDSSADTGVGNVRITATDLDNGASFSTETSSSGFYQLILPVGRKYTLSRNTPIGYFDGPKYQPGGYVTDTPTVFYTQTSSNRYENINFKTSSASSCYGFGFFNFILAETRPGEQGLAYNPNSPISDQKAGSVLIYPVYSSGAASFNAENTRISITNVHPTKDIAVHLFFVDGSNCSVADSYLCLTPNQTSTFLTSDIDPGVSGYVVAIAVNPATGCPIPFNHLIGEEYVKFSTGHAANLAAEAIAARPNSFTTCNTNATTANINFDDFSYNRVPRVLAVNNLPSPADGNSSLLILNRIGGNLATGANRIGSVFGLLFDDTESAFSFSISGGCQIRQVLSDSFPRTTPRLSQVVPAGRSGWMKLWSNGVGSSADPLTTPGIIGAIINANPGAANPNAFNQGHNLHKLSLTSDFFVIPVFPPNC